jgi:hypothetical protein
MPTSTSEILAAFVKGILSSCTEGTSFWTRTLQGQAFRQLVEEEVATATVRLEGNFL